MHPNSELLFRKYALPVFKDGMKVLEIGPDSKAPYVFKDIVGNDTIVWETMDLDRNFEELTYVSGNEYSFPIPDNTFDLVFSSSVIEHVRKVWIWVKELARVCKPNGYVITINPVSWPYHAVPFDCWRIYPDGMKALYEEAGLNVCLGICETLEKAPSRRSFPGASYQTEDRFRPRLKSWIQKLIGWPLSCSVDTITIGTKEVV